MLPSSPLLDETLRVVDRRYRLPVLATTFPDISNASPSTALAIAIEKARVALACGDVPEAALKDVLIESLAQMIHDAMRPEYGDPAFQAMVLRHGAIQVREYASLLAHADQDRREILAAVNAIAHPAKQQRIPPGQQREALAQLHASASSASWAELPAIAQRLLAMPQIADHASFERGLTRLLDGPALGHLQRLDALASDDLVRRYQSLWDKNGPRSGSAAAAAQGSASQQRGGAVEALATQALEALAERLNKAEGAVASYRVVTSMRVPASIPGNSARAKTEWDVVLLRQAQGFNETPVWDICLFVEAKASVEAATTDLPRLLRGLRLLAHAEDGVVYSFKTQQGMVSLRSASLRALTTDEADLARTVLYCCDAPAEATPRLLSAASRMQLLSAQACLEFASVLEEKQSADAQALEPVWQQLLEAPQWGAVLNQFQMLRQVRELMVHVEDLLVAAR